MDEPVFSPDGQWMWTGTTWIPAPPESGQSKPPSSIQDSVVTGDVNHITNISTADSEIIKVALDSAIELSGIAQESVQQDERVVKIPMEILEQCRILEAPNKSEYAVEWHIPGDSPPEFRAAIQAIGGSHRRTNSPLENYDITVFDAETQAKVWSMWNEAKNLWRIYDEKHNAPPQVLVQTQPQMVIQSPQAAKGGKGVMSVIVGIVLFVIALSLFSEYLDAAEAYEAYCTGFVGAIVKLLDGQSCEEVKSARDFLLVASGLSGLCGLGLGLSGLIALGSGGTSQQQLVMVDPSVGVVKDGGERGFPKIIAGITGVIVLIAAAVVFSGMLYVWAVGTGDSTARSWSVIRTHTITIQEDEYYMLSDISGFSEYKWELTPDTSIAFDVYFLDKENCEQWENSGEVKIYSSLSWGNMNSAGSKGPVTFSTTQEYCWVVDNTDRGEAYPPWNGVNDPITISFTFSGK